jgi:BON domain
MSQHPLPAPHARRGRFPFAILCSLALAAGSALVVGLASAADAQPPAAAPKPPATPDLSDVMLARTALTALDAEPELRGVNLVVSVVDRVAVIGGPVPTPAAAKRAEQVVRKVEGITDVRNTCFVAAGPDPLLKAVADRVGSSLPPRPVMAELPGVLTNQLTPPAPVSPFPPAAVPDAVAGAGKPGGSTVVTLRPPLAGGVGVLGAPVGPVGSGTVSAAAPPASPPATAPGLLTGTTPGTASDVLTAAAAVRKSEVRFAKLTVELRDGVLVIGGSAPLASDAWALAQKLRQIPGVARVAVGAVAGN